MLDSLIGKYISVHENVSAMLNEMENTGVIPHADVEGAPTSVEAARHAFIATLIAVENIVQDLNILALDRDFK